MGKPVVDAEGYLIDPAAWTEAFAAQVAAGEAIELTAEHWSVIRFMRDFYEQNGVPPDARFVMRHLAQAHGAARNRLFDLFPYGYVQQACRMAGMRRPRIWSTG